MPVDSRIRLIDLLPAGALELMRGMPRRRDAIAIPRDADLVEFLRSSGSTELESAGLIGDGWITRVSGDPWQVRAESGRFTWHSHAAGPAVFSIEDFLVFHAIGGVWHLLVTPSEWCVYIAAQAPRGAVPDRSILTGPPTLRMRRAARWAEKTLGSDLTSIKHDRVCEHFGLRRCDALATIADASIWSEGSLRESSA